MTGAGRDFQTVRWEDMYELGEVAEAAYIEHELQVRGDGMWRPWLDLDHHQRDHWERIATAMLRTLNQRRMKALRPEGK